MKANATNIWAAPAYLPYVQPPLTDRMVADAERKIGYKLPRELIDALKVQNGGYIRYRLPDSIHDTISGIGPNFPSLTAFSWDDEFFAENVSFPLQGLVPFDGDGHWYLCLDYRKHADVPAVTYIDVECDSQEPIANSFAEYLSQLQVDAEDGEYVVSPITDIPSIIAQIAGRLKLKVEQPDSWSQGYPVYSAVRKTRKGIQGAWISPNRVPRGFAREDEPNYETLRQQMPGETLRYPELPEASCILGTTDEIREQVLGQCRELKLEVRSLQEYLNGGASDAL
jgi:hypothetical protein